MFRGDRTVAAPWMIAAGLAFGLGVNIRVDVIFPSVAALFWLLAAHPRPYRAASLVALGLAPGLIAATLINEVKFGVFSPLIYGDVGGRVSIGYYATVLPFVAAGAAGVLLLGLAPIRRALLRPAVLALAGAVAVVACLIAPPLQTMAVKTVLGAWGLVVDFQAHVFAAKGLSVDEHGRLIAFGHVKRALLQSMPYLTVALAALPLLFHACIGRQTLLLIFITGLTIAPFAYGAWFGGMGSRMRYFLHCLPALAILAALGLGQLGGRVTQGLLVALTIGAAGAVGVHFTNNLAGRAPWWSISAPDVLIVVSPLPIIAAALLPGLAPGWLRLSARQSVYAGVALTVTVIWGGDLKVAHQVRDLHARFAANAAQVLPPNALLATFHLQYYDLRVNDADARTSWIKFADPDISDDLVALTKASFNEGRPVFVQGGAAAQALIDRGAAETATPLFGVNEYSDLYRMSAPD